MSISMQNEINALKERVAHLVGCIESLSKEIEELKELSMQSQKDKTNEGRIQRK